jgi:hypothetical protein
MSTPITQREPNRSAFHAAEYKAARASGEPGRFRLWAIGSGDCYRGAVAVPLMKVCAMFQSS